jgi:hypothetical protein
MTQHVAEMHGDVQGAGMCWDIQEKLVGLEAGVAWSKSGLLKSAQLPSCCCLVSVHCSVLTHSGCSCGWQSDNSSLFPVR